MVSMNFTVSNVDGTFAEIITMPNGDRFISLRLTDTPGGAAEVSFILPGFDRECVVAARKISTALLGACALMEQQLNEDLQQPPQPIAPPLGDPPISRATELAPETDKLESATGDGRF